MANMFTEKPQQKTQMGQSIASKTLTQVAKDQEAAEKANDARQSAANIGNAIAAEVELVNEQIVKDAGKATEAKGGDAQKEYDKVNNAVVVAQHKVAEKQQAQQKADQEKAAAQAKEQQAKAEHAKA